MAASDPSADSSLPAAANGVELGTRVDRGLVTMRELASVRAGTHAYDADHLVTGWHSHDLHQVEYALAGVAEVETGQGRYLVPPQQAIWIPAGVEHDTTLQDARTASVFFDPAMVPVELGVEVKVLAATPVLREMIVFALRWPIGRLADVPTGGSDADTFFGALALVVADCLDREHPLWLPTSTDPLIGAVLAYTRGNLATVTPADIRDALGVSERTLRRRFREVTGMTWRTYLLHARLVRAMELLGQPGPGVLDVAASVGFDSVSAFTRAFRTWSGFTPAAYRSHVRQRLATPSP